MKTKQLLVVALIASLALNVVFAVLYLNTFTCPLEDKTVLEEEKTETNIDYNQEQLSELALACQEQGSWLEEEQECEWIVEDWCQDMGGNFNACASACRHMDPEVAEFCTMECVPVCSFN